MSKILELYFNVDGGKVMTLSVANPKEDLTLATVKEKAEKLIPVLISGSGAEVLSFKQAKLVETSSTVLE